MKPICPNCDAVLPKLPTRKTKCKACGQFIYVKSTPANRTKRLMTEIQAEDADRQWHERYEHSRPRGNAPPQDMESRMRWALLAATEDLERLRRHGDRAEILAGPAPCSSCRALRGAIWKIDDALRSMPIPNARCELFQRGGGCCAFWAVPK